MLDGLLFLSISSRANYYKDVGGGGDVGGMCLSVSVCLCGFTHVCTQREVYIYKRRKEQILALRKREEVGSF